MANTWCRDCSIRRASMANDAGELVLCADCHFERMRDRAREASRPRLPGNWASRAWREGRA